MAESRHTPGPNLDAILKGLKDLDGLQTKVGYFKTNKYPDGTPVAYVASIQEFGHGAIPPRPFFRPTIAAKDGAWRTLATNACKGVVTGKRTAFTALDLLGLRAAGDVRATIAALTTPPLKKSTLKARKARGNSSQKPLVDTRILFPTLTHITDTDKT